VYLYNKETNNGGEVRICTTPKYKTQCLAIGHEKKVHGNFGLVGDKQPKKGGEG
jgi:hypothetical protein